MGEERLTYGELEELESNRSGAAARGEPAAVAAIASASVCRSARRQSWRCIATLKADCVYVPLDVGEPRARGSGRSSRRPNRSLAADDGRRAAALVDGLARRPACRRSSSARSRARSSGTGARHPSQRTDADGYSDGRVASSTQRSDDAAHILFTSGSTGTPKGVVITARNVAPLRRVGGRATSARRAADRMSGHPPLHFDLSTFDIYGDARRPARSCILCPRGQPAAPQARRVHPRLAS